MAEETDTLTIRVPKSLKSYIEERSKEKGTSINNLLNTILSQKLYWDDHLSELGWMYFHPGVVRWLFSNLSENEVKALSSDIHKDILKGVQFLYEEYNMENIIKFFHSWLDSSNTTYRFISKGDANKFIVKHDLGSNWSLFSTGIIQHIISSAGFGVKNITYDESQYSFEIVPQL